MYIEPVRQVWKLDDLYCPHCPSCGALSLSDDVENVNETSCVSCSLVRRVVTKAELLKSCARHCIETQGRSSKEALVQLAGFKR